MLKAGDLNRRVILQTRTQGKDSSGHPTIIWADLDEVWAQVQDKLPSRGESIADGLNVANRPCRIRIRYRDDITADMRVIYEGRTLRIVTMPAELGHRDGIEFMAEQLTTAGEEP